VPLELHRPEPPPRPLAPVREKPQDHADVVPRVTDGDGDAEPVDAVASEDGGGAVGFFEFLGGVFGAAGGGFGAGGGGGIGGGVVVEVVGAAVG